MSKTRAKVVPSKTPTTPSKAPGNLSLVDLAIRLGLLLAIFLVYFDVGRFDFTTYDDDVYVTANAHVRAGLTAGSLKWAATEVVDYWVPVTLLSHMVACQFFQQESGMHHLVNLLLHALATLLLFTALERATRARWPSAFVAMMFAVHPLHVESVAWITERKDVLSAFFGFLALYCYVRYVEAPSLRRYLLVAMTFALGLMSKPMLVTFPFVLLLLDFWPLHRAQFPKVLWEKLPLIALSIAASFTTFLLQKSMGIVQKVPLPVRVENALISYMVYLGKMFWPTRLAVLYPYQYSPSPGAAAAAAALLLAITVAVMLVWRTRSYLAVGWFWYLGMLVPVIGFVQAGLQVRADRYMYIPMVGLLMMLAWGAAGIIEKWPRAKLGIALAASASCIACASAARIQTQYWQNSETLYSRAINVTQDNYVAEYNLGSYLMTVHRGPEAIPYLEAALRIKPDYPEAENNLGMALGNIPGRLPEALAHFETAVRMKPDLVQAQFNLAVALQHTPGRKSDALRHYEVIQRLQPSPEIAGIIEKLRKEQP